MNRVVVARLLDSRRRLIALTWARRAEVIRMQLVRERSTAA